MPTPQDQHRFNDKLTLLSGQAYP